jgi:hypothetical protein
LASLFSRRLLSWETNEENKFHGDEPVNLVSQIKERNRILFYFEFYDENKNKLK